jgi:hypothetical protein
MGGTDLLFEGARLLAQLRPSATGRRHTGDVVHRDSRRQRCVLVFWHDAVAAALAADVTRAKTLSGGRKRGADTLRSRISTTKVIRRRHARPHQHHPVKLTYSQDGTSSLSIWNFYGQLRRATVQSRMAEGSSNCSLLLVLPPKFLQIIHCRGTCLLTQYYSLRPKSYV